MVDVAGIEPATPCLQSVNNRIATERGQCLQMTIGSTKFGRCRHLDDVVACEG